MKTRKTYPTAGIYAVQRGSLASSYYFTPQDERRFRYVRPDNPQPSNWCADCWLVDRQGNINPGTNVSPVPVHRDVITRRICS